MNRVCHRSLPHSPFPIAHIAISPPWQRKRHSATPPTGRCRSPSHRARWVRRTRRPPRWARRRLQQWGHQPRDPRQRARPQGPTAPEAPARADTPTPRRTESGTPSCAPRTGGSATTLQCAGDTAASNHGREWSERRAPCSASAGVAARRSNSPFGGQADIRRGDAVTSIPTPAVKRAMAPTASAGASASKKSRSVFGCGACKKRKIKCDEKRVGAK